MMNTQQYSTRNRVKTYSFMLTLWEDIPLDMVKSCLNGWVRESFLSLVRKGEGIFLLTIREYAYPRKLIDRMDNPLWRLLKTVNDETYDTHTASGYEGSLYHVHSDGAFED